MLYSSVLLVLLPLLVPVQTALAEDAQNTHDVDEIAVAAGVAELQDLLVRLETESNFTTTHLLLSDVPRNGSDESTNSDTPTLCADLVPVVHNVLNRTQHTLSTLALLEYRCANSNSSFVEEVLRGHDLPRLSHLAVAITDAWSPRIQNAIVQHNQTLTHLHIATSFESALYVGELSTPPSLPVILEQLPELRDLTLTGPQGRWDVPEIDRFPLYGSAPSGFFFAVGKWLGRATLGPSLIPENFTLSIRPGPNPGRDDAECGTTSATYHGWVQGLEKRHDVGVLGPPCKTELSTGPSGVEYDPYEYGALRPATLEDIYPLECAIDAFLATVRP